MKKLILVLLSVFAFSYTVSAQEKWKTYPPSVTAVAVEGDHLWLGMGNKVVKWHKQQGILAEYTQQNGLPGAIINELYVGENHTVWAASDSGLARFDGASWKTYTTKDGLADNYIHRVDYTGGQVVLGRNGTVWVGSGKGLSYFNGKSWSIFNTSNGLLSNNITALAMDSTGTVWAGTDSGASAYDGISWKNYTINNGLITNNVTQIVIDRKNVKWIICQYGGLARFDGVSWKTFDKNNGQKATDWMEIAVGLDNTLFISEGDFTGLGGGQIRYNTYLFKYDGINFLQLSEGHSQFTFGQVTYENLVIDKKGLLWFFYKLHVYWCDGNSVQLVNSVPASQKDVVFDQDNILWMATGDVQNYIRPYNLAWFDGSIHYQPFGPLTKNINLIITDKNNIKWVGSDWGLVSSSKGIWNLPISIGPDVKTFAIEQDNTVWIGNNGGASHGFSNELDGYPLPSDTVSTIAIDQNDVKWFGFGSSGGGVASYGTYQKVYSTADGLASNQVQVITVDKNNVKWFGTFDGLSSYDGTNWKSYRADSSGNPLGMITSIVFDKNQALWLGTNNGLVKFDGSVWKRYTQQDGLVNDLVTALSIGPNDVKWIGTPSGVSRFDGASWQTFTTVEGLPDNTVKTISVDYDNVVWVGTSQGLVSYQDTITPTFVRESASLPAVLSILSVAPNPFNPSTTITFSIPISGQVSLVVYNLAGQKVRELVSGHFAAGTHSAVWNGRDARGNVMSSGIYLSRLVMGKNVAVKKMLLLK